MKLDLLKSDPAYYKAKLDPAIVQLGTYHYITISGQGDPNSDEFMDAIGAIYTVAYKIKFICKGSGDDFVVPKMECFWWIEGGLQKQHLFTNTPRNKWHWKIVIRMPEVVQQALFDQSQDLCRANKISKVDDLKFEMIQEGLSAQILHLGSYSNEKASIIKLHALIEESEYKISGYHKEIYLSDPRRTPEDKLRTILRYQIQ